MADLVFRTGSLQELGNVAGQILQHFPDHRFFAVYGEMGAGKTTLIKAICSSLDIVETAVSPSFAIINEYRTNSGEPVYHFDFYRINNIREVYDIGYEEYFFSGRYCFAEWPERVDGLLPKDHIAIIISVLPNESRNIVVSKCNV
ncbi:MAG: tRNA (adenosine(37)-N6)-threonylcarbamoyltransferase complex ATPase subunit type 1 TsaE [Bacteroidetes bacterium]|nr:tRNA (adenosine(37)-N6)-threonylcarbamoyltransferase complex ATPase subunit type 1 TsaE [Bacteroidota bacterium]